MKRIKVKATQSRMDQFTKRKSGFKWSHRAVTLALLFGAVVSIVAQGRSPSLAGAVESRNSARTSKFLSNQIDVNIPQVDGMTALHWAAYHDNWELGKRFCSGSSTILIKADLLNFSDRTWMAARF